ncbi:MAG: hypothetical protein AB1898_10375 [Acidobacteriota bacterium]
MEGENLANQSGSASTPRRSFENQLTDIIVHHLSLLSEDGKLKVLDYVNAMIDLEEKRIEFNRRQGRLYNWSELEHQA